MTEALQQATVWDYFKPRHTHAWNMLQIAAAHLYSTDDQLGFEAEYAWENLIIRLVLYRNVVKTLTHLCVVEEEMTQAIARFDKAFSSDGKNALVALRNMFEHFDDYAAGKGRGPAERATDLDPWRFVSIDKFNRGQFELDLTTSMDAANSLRGDAQLASDKFIEWCKQKTRDQQLKDA